MPLHPFLAALVASLLGSLSGAFLLTVFGYTGRAESLGLIIGGTAAVALYGFIVAVPVVVLYGMPLYAGLRRVGAANVGTALVFGSLPGVAWILWTRGSWLDPILWIGALVAVLYCLLRERGAARPNPSIERTCPGEPGQASHVKR